MTVPPLDLATRFVRTAFVAVAVVPFAACDASAGRGSLSVLLESEDVVTEGLVPGDGPEDIHDGWSVTFDRYLVAVGGVDLQRSTEPSHHEVRDAVHVVDLTSVDASGLALWSFDSIASGRWEFGYSVPVPTASATRHDSVAPADFEAMIAAGFTHLVDGTMRKSDGQSCPPATLASPGARVSNGNTSGGNACYDAPEVRFTFGATAPIGYGPCEIDGLAGVSVVRSGTTTAGITFHGDHLFFNGFPEGSEGGIVRLAQWLADCDLDLDGVVTAAELEAIDPQALAEIDARYQLGGTPITPLDDMLDYVRAQLVTQGHFQGEGECPLR